MKAKDMREKSPEDLRELEKSLTHDHFQAKLKNFTNRLDDTSSIGKTRRDLARVKTLLAETARGIKHEAKPALPKPVAPAPAPATAKVAPASKPAAKVKKAPESKPKAAAASKPAAKKRTTK
jgi:large subunit ribosomal protein L29